MAAITQSGYPVIPKYGDPQIQPLTVAGVSIAPGVRKGDVHTILGWVAARFNATVTPLKAGQCWGYSPRKIRGGTGWSNHASGTAIDCNSAVFPQGTKRMTAAERKACKAIVKACRGVVRWGGSYVWPTQKDQMHFEINNGKAGTKALATLAADIRAGKLGSTADVTPATSGGVTAPGVTVAQVQRALGTHGAHLVVDDVWGPKTRAAVIAFQKAQHLTQDGYVGPKTWAALIVTPPAKETELSKAQARYEELANQYGIGKAAFGHFRTQFGKIVAANTESAVRRYLVDFNEMFDGKSYTAAQWLHLLRAQLNIEELSS